MANCRRPRSSPFLSLVELQFKLSRIASHHEQVKISFHQLKSQIEIGLLEAEDVFASLATPLMSLVCLKTVEMAEGGRCSTIFMGADLNPLDYRRSKVGANSSENSMEGGDLINQILELEDSSYATKATMACEELMQRQRLQLTKLIHLLRQIETQVNHSQNNILQILADHRASIHRFFQRATAFLSFIRQSSKNDDNSLIMLKLLKAAFDLIGATLGSVEGGVEDLIHELSEQMCNPMVEYTKVLKAELVSGTCMQLLAVVEEMGGVMRDRRLELEASRKNAKIAEERNIEALSRLKLSEDTGRRMKEYIGSFLAVKNVFRKHSLPRKILEMEEADQTSDEKVLWELKCQTPDNPLGAKEHFGRGPNNKRFKPTKVRSSTGNTQTTASYSRGLSPHTPCLDYWLPLGSSPSAASHQVLSPKCVTS